MAEPALPIKKQVELRWRGLHLRFDVAQELFSSHQVDRGSRMLLGSLDPAAFPADGRGADFGCGYGVLGIAWQAASPGWAMRYVDRDALAVAFSAHNAARLLAPAAGATAFHTDIALHIEEGGYDLVLWNVPGKAGRDVLAALRDGTLGTLAPEGLLAAVIVNPLADLFTGDPADPAFAVERVDSGREHTVVHLRRRSGAPRDADPFGAGAFDRPKQAFGAAGLSWELTPVTGLPEYDSLDHATSLAVAALADLRDTPVARWLVIEPGVGHLACAARQAWPEAVGAAWGRDALALAATRRAVGAAEVEVAPAWGLPALAGAPPTDVVTLALPAQTSREALGDALAALEGLVAPDGAAVLHGRSTEVARVGQVVNRGTAWRAGPAAKLRGSACTALRRRPTP